MEKTLQFKTNISCGGCLAKVTPILNQAEGICHWDIDLENEQKILTVRSDGIESSEVKKKIEDAGYSISEIL